MRVFEPSIDYVERFDKYNGEYDYLMQVFFDDAYGQANFIGQNMSKKGYPSIEIIPNYKKAQFAWANENVDISLNLENWKENIFHEQIAHYKPEILLFVGWTYGGTYIKDLKKKYSFIRKIIFWVGEALPDASFMKFFDSVFSCDKGNVIEMKSQNKSSYHIDHAFNYSLNKYLCERDKKNQISFSGSLKHGDSEHSYRAEILSCLNDKYSMSLNGNVYVPSIYTKNIRGRIASYYHDVIELIDDSSFSVEFLKSNNYKKNISLRADFKLFLKLSKKFKKPLYGLEYLQNLKDSNIVLNTHSNTSYACNMRLFESTGVGSCLLTDYKKNISELFEVDDEIVCYKSVDEMLEKVDYLINNPKVVNEIGRKAMLKTQKSHDYSTRIDSYIYAINQILNEN